MKYFVNDIRNTIDFFLRNHITFSRKNYYEESQDLDGIFNNIEQGNLYHTIKEKYGDILSQNTTRRLFILNLYYLNIFDKCFSRNIKNNLSILDIGSKNWEYVRSEYTFFNSFSNEFTLNGIELDAYRLCSNLYNRYEIAKFYTKNLPNTNYIPEDFLTHNNKYDYIIWILPFITEYPLIKWGLPLKYFKPSEMLLHAYELLKPEGELLIINQGEEEYSIQQELITKTLNDKNDLFSYLPLGEISDCFNIYKNRRYCSRLIKSSHA